MDCGGLLTIAEEAFAIKEIRQTLGLSIHVQKVLEMAPANAVIVWFLPSPKLRDL